MIKLNNNPKGIRASDCVVRAISYVTDQTWDKVYQDLCSLGFKMKRMPNEKNVYEKYMEQLGWQKVKQPKKDDKSKYTIQDFIDLQLHKGKVLISVANHLTAVHNFKLVDTWDCSYKCIGNYWIKNI